ncbi:MAG: efflux RND transporter permease subunit [Planctomycetota bacterium]
MSHALSTTFFKEPRLLLLAIALIAVAGLSSLIVLPRAEDPRITNRGAGIVTRLPGADAELVEALVTEPIEDALLELDEVYSVDSTSRAGVSVIRVEVEDAIGMRTIEQAWSQVRDRLGDVENELPPGASKPDFESDDFWAMTVIAGITWESESPVSPAILSRLAEDLEDRLRAIEGTEYTELAGVSREEILVEVDQRKLAGLGLSADDVAARVRSADAKVAAGQLRSGERDFVLEVEGELDSLERLRSVNLATGSGGAFVRLGDVASVTKQIEDPPSRIALLSGERGVAVGARLAVGGRVDLWSAQAREIVEAFDDELGPGLSATVIFDQSGYTESRLAGLVQNFGLGVLAVIAVIFVLMGWRSALLIGATLPLTALAVLFEMRLLGIPIHQMSVTGLIIALGLLIDNAIVVVDDVTRRRAAGNSAVASIRQAISHLAVPLLGSTATTVMAFAPIVLMPGGAGEFVGTIALGVILALISSFAISMTIIPAIVGRLGIGSGNGWWTRGVPGGWLGPSFERLVRLMVGRPALGLVASMVVPLSGFYAATTLVTQFFPGADRDQFQLRLRLPHGSSMAATEDAVRRTLDELDGFDRVTDVHFFLGDSSPMFYYNLAGREDDSPHYASALVQLDSHVGATGEIRRIQAALENAMPDVQVVAQQLEQGPPFDAPIEVKFFGEDTDVLRRLGDRTRQILAEQADVTAVRTTMVTGRPQVSVALDEQAAGLAGLDNRVVAAQLDASMEGVFGGSLLEDNEEVPVRVRLSSADRRDMSDVASVDLFGRASSGARDAVPVSVIGDLSVVPEVASLDRENGRRVNRVYGFVEAGVLPGTILPGFLERLNAELDIPAGYELSVGGESGERGRAIGNLMASVAILGVLMGATLILSFNSVRTAGIVALVAIGAAGAGFLSLAAFGYPNGFMAIVGTMGLVGVAINDAIVVLAAIRADDRAKTGDLDAVVRIVGHEARHVVATTLTTIAGFTPLILSGGTFWPPMAVVIGGGVLAATVLGLICAPAAYRLAMTGSVFGPIRFGRTAVVPAV